MVAGRGKIWIPLSGGALLLIISALWFSHRCMAVPSGMVNTAQGKGQVPSASEDATGSFKYTNRLIREKSPYLLMHAHNPVDWYPWGQEAFEKARREQKPIFLSVGYYTCHWCHVMERESFSDPGIAEIMNGSFVSIKVDREERPDVDRIYMNFVQATTGSGGWPMSVFLTPELKPFLGGTYFPKDDNYGRPGFRTVLTRVADAWQKDRGKILRSADQATQALQQYVNADIGETNNLQKAVLDKTYQQIQASYDSTHGGFGAAPKFPRPVVFNFLLRYYARTGQKDALEMTLKTLREMAHGASTTTSAADSIVIRPTPFGMCRILRRCSTTRPSSPSLIPRPTRLPTIHFSPTQRGTSWGSCCAICGRRRVASTPRWMRTA